MNLTSCSKQNRTALAVLCTVLAVVCLLFSLPTYNFNACIYTKKSSNTFKGDDKYNEVLAEVNSVAEEYREKGFDVEISEEFTERVNSKGETTSLAAFSINEEFKLNTWSFLGAGISSSKVLLVIVICIALSLACALAGTIPTIDVPYKYLDRKSKVLRSMAGWFALIAMLLIPVFVMMNTYNMSRRVTLYNADLLTEGKEELYSSLDAFLFDGLAGENIDTVLKNLTFKNTGTVWFAIPMLFLAVLSAMTLRHGTIKSTLLRGLLYAFVIVICIITLYPYYVMFVTGFRSAAETNDMNFTHMFPVKWLWSNLTDISGLGGNQNRNVFVWLKNSLFIAGGATLVAMICGIPAAYAMARMKFKGKNAFLGFVIMSQMFAPVVLLIGIYQLMSSIGLTDSIIGLMLINAAFNQAFAIWLLRGTFISISPEMEQAALIDGCNTFKSLTRILLPMAAPGIVTALIFVFINAWNEYTISTVLITTIANKPITVGITTFSSFNMIEWQYLFAASLLATIPVVILFVCIEKHLTAGLTSGGVKG